MHGMDTHFGIQLHLMNIGNINFVRVPSASGMSPELLKKVIFES